MRYQELTFSCGPSAVVNSLRAFGVRVSERKVRKLAGTGPDGTDGSGIVTAVRALGFQAADFATTSRHTAWRWLHGAISQGSVVILCVDLWRHWVAVIAIATDRVVLIDSAKTNSNMRENGIHVLSKDRLMHRWRSSLRATDNTYEAICISKAKR